MTDRQKRAYQRAECGADHVHPIGDAQRLQQSLNIVGKIG
jgi:hypothetical protein